MAKTSPVSPGWVRDGRWNKEVPVSTVSLPCQSILVLPMPLKWLSPHKAGFLFTVWWSHTTSRKRDLTLPDVPLKWVFTVIYLSLGHTHLGLAWALILLISFTEFLKSHLTCRFVFTAVHAVCFKGYDDAWSCECRIKNSVFQGHAFWSGISPLRSYSQLHSRSPWKGILGCIAERFDYRRSKTLIILKTWRPGSFAEAGMCRMWRAFSSEAEWHSEETLKCHFKLTDGGSTAGVWGEYWSSLEQQSLIHKLCNITEVHLLEYLNGMQIESGREVMEKEQARTWFGGK